MPDGLNGFPEALNAVYPRAAVQLCIVHKVRSSLRYVPYKDRKAVAADLRTIYTAATVTEAQAALKSFGERWNGRYPAISQAGNGTGPH